MGAIGYVTKHADGIYKGSLRTLSIKANIEIIPNKGKKDESHPDYRVVADGNIDLGAGWNRIGEQSGKPYVSMSLAAPEFGRRLFCNLGRAAGQDDDDVYAVIWNPQD